MKKRWIALLAGAIAAVLIFAFRAPLGRAAIAGLIDVLTGSRVSFTGLNIRGDGLEAEGLSVRRGGEPLLDARRLAIAYDLRDLFPGGTHRFGLHSIELDGPQLTLVRHADGSFNLGGGGSGGGSASAPGSASGAPLLVRGTIRDGAIELLDPHRVDPAVRRLHVDDIQASFALDSAGRSTYRVRAAFAGTPLSAIGTVDVPRGYALHRLRAGSLQIASVLNYVINYRAAHVLSARLDGLDVVVYGFGSSAGEHFAGGARLSGGAMLVPGLRLPLRDLAGRFDLFDGGVASARLDATLAGLPLQAAGGIYDWQDPAFRLGLRTGGPLATLRTVFTFARNLPLAGDVSVGANVEGPVGEPLVSVRFASPRFTYGKIPIDAAQGQLIYYNSSLAFVRAGARYGPVAAVIHGGVDLGDTATSQLVLDGIAPPGSVPFVAQAVPRVPLHATAVLGGSDLAVDVRGIADGAAGDESVHGLFRVDRHGDGEFGPFSVRQGGGSAAGAFYADRSSSQSGFWVDLRNFDVRRSLARPQLPGLPHLAPPDFGGRLDAALAGEGHPSNFRLAGRAHVRDLVSGRYAIGDVSGVILGGIDDLRASSLAASGPWGTFAGSGAYQDGRLALAGRYRGRLEQLAQFTGPLGARGALDAPVVVLLEHDATIVQADGAGLSGGSVRGVPVADVRGTIAVEGGTLRVYAATARVAGGTFATAGSVGGNGRLGMSLAGADAAQLRSLGSPLERGRVFALGSARQTPEGPGFDGALALAAGRVGRFSLAGSSGVGLSGNRVALSDGQALLDGTYGTFEGGVAGLGGRAAQLDLDVRAEDAALAHFARLAVPSRHDITGTFDADFHIAGTSAAPQAAGRLTLPEGSFQGQAFRDASALIAVDRNGLAADDGTIAVGSTHVGFAGTYRPGNLSARLAAPQADLSDFDDLFDTGDTLDGRGRANANFSRRGRELSTSADVAFDGLRYLRFDLGDSTAHWSSDGRNVDGALAFGGESGRVAASGNVFLAPRAPIETLLRHSRFNGSATLRDFDLNRWLPLLGYNVPLTGRVDADATITGSLTDPKLAIDAHLAQGRYAKFPIKSLSLKATADVRSLVLDSAQLDLGTLQASGSGTVGLGPHDPLALSIHATSTDLAGLGNSVTGAQVALTGFGEADVKLRGTRSEPSVAGGFYVHDATLQGLAIPSALGQFRLEGRAVELESGELQLAKGRLDLAGSVPFTFSPFGFGPPDAPVDVEVTVRDLDLASVAPLLPKGSTLAGLIEGRVGVSGTAGRPRLAGGLTLDGGVFSTPFEAEPLSKIGAALSFSGNQAKLERFHAEGGGGTIDASGQATLGLDAGYSVAATARHLRLDLPAYGRGTIDGNLSLARSAGQIATLSGKLSLQDTIIPFSALSVAGSPSDDSGVPGLVGPQAPGSRAGPARPNLALALDVAAERNVRVRSANIDIGGTGALHLGGTLAEPKLSGELDSTGGTLSYFNTVFRVQSGAVTFAPDQGLVPTLKAVATTHVFNPDPNAFRNISGSADITITISGPVTKLDIALSSTPSYDRDQILGLLLGAPTLGANLFDPNGVYAGSVSKSTSGDVTVGRQAFGIANAQFTKNLLAPLETQAAGALGLSNLNVNVDYTGTVGLTARKVLGKQVNAVYSQTFGYPTRQSFGFELKPNPNTAAQVTVFTTIGAQNLYIAYPALGYSPQATRINAAQPIGGTSGVAFSLQLLLP